MSNEHLQHRVIEYLYGDLTADARQQFESALQADPQLQALLDEELQFNSTVVPGMQPAIDDERLQGNRWVLRQKLQRASQPHFFLSRWWQELRARPLAFAFQGAAMAMTFVLGLFVASTGEITQLPNTGDLVAANSSPLALVNDDDFEIFQLRVNEYDPNTGAIDLSFSLSSETRLTGNVADNQIHQLMAVALQDDIDSGARLDTINALQQVSSGDEVYEALIYVLSNDENPGVRYQAVRALVDLADQERVRDALRLALRRDMNQGVRVEAFNALMNYPDEQTMDLFREQMQSDGNEYIRAQSRSIVEGTAGPDNAIF